MSGAAGGRGGALGMAPLEQRYRRVLRALPAAYRAVWEEEMVATFLDGMYADAAWDDDYLAYCGRPSRAELASVIALAVRLRLGGVEAPPRSRLWGSAVQRVALVGLLAYAVGGTVMVAQQLWVSGAIGGPAVPAAVAALGEPGQPGRLDVAWAAAWVVAFVTLVLGRRRTATAFAGVGLALTVAGRVQATVSTLDGGFLRPGVLTGWAELLIVVAVVLALAAFHREAPAVQPRPWLVAYAGGLLLLTALTAAFVLLPSVPLELLDVRGVWSVALVVAGVVCLFVPAVGRRCAPAWPLTLTMLAAGVLGLRLLLLVDYALAGHPTMWATGALPAATITETAALAAVGVLLAIRAARTLREHPTSAGVHTPTP